MSRARRAGPVALSLALVLALVAASLAVGGPPAAIRTGWPSPPSPSAAVAWPVSTLVISEVQTGGASASDEFVELSNAGPLPVDLAGLEVVYATSTGSTVTRKATWTTPTAARARPARAHRERRRHLTRRVPTLTYSGGFAATGGALVLRPVGGTPIDAVAWGDATNAFVEGVGRRGAGRGLEHRAAARRSGRQRHRHE